MQLLDPPDPGIVGSWDPGILGSWIPGSGGSAVALSNKPDKTNKSNANGGLDPGILRSWDPSIIHGYSVISMDIHGYTRIFHRCAWMVWIFMTITGYALTSSMDVHVIHAYPLASIVCQTSGIMRHASCIKHVAPIIMHYA